MPYLILLKFNSCGNNLTYIIFMESNSYQSNKLELLYQLRLQTIYKDKRIFHSKNIEWNQTKTKSLKSVVLANSQQLITYNFQQWFDCATEI